MTSSTLYMDLPTKWGMVCQTESPHSRLHRPL